MKSGNTAVTKVNWDVGQVFDGNRLPKLADDGLRVIGSHLEDDVASCVAPQRCQDLARNLFSELVGDDEVGSVFACYRRAQPVEVADGGEGSSEA